MQQVITIKSNERELTVEYTDLEFGVRYHNSLLCEDMTAVFECEADAREYAAIADGTLLVREVFTTSWAIVE